MRMIYWAIGGLVLGGIFGLMSAVYLSGVTPSGMNRSAPVVVDGWQSDWSIGSPAAGRYQKAWVARYGLLAMQKSEAVYFIRSHDEQGASMREDCRYLVSGADLPAEWWSVTLYDRLAYLPNNTHGHLSFDASDARNRNDWQFEVAPERPEDGTAWVSSRAAETFDLTLRLYRPNADFLNSPERGTPFPTITRLSCKQGGGT